MGNTLVRQHGVTAIALPTYQPASCRTPQWLVPAKRATVSLPPCGVTRLRRSPQSGRVVNDRQQARIACRTAVTAPAAGARDPSATPRRNGTAAGRGRGNRGSATSVAAKPCPVNAARSGTLHRSRCHHRVRVPAIRRARAPSGATRFSRNPRVASRPSRSLTRLAPLRAPPDLRGSADAKSPAARRTSPALPIHFCLGIVVHTPVCIGSTMHQRYLFRLTPELSRPAKRVRLE